MTGLTLTHKIQLSPNKAQAIYFQKACGTARFVWNWALARWQQEYEQGNKPTGLGLKKIFNAIKGDAYPWVYEVTKYASQQPFIFLQEAFKRFFNKIGGYPKFKQKGVHDSFYIGNDHIKLEGKRIRIPKLGWVKLCEVLRFQGRILSATISKVADRWFVSLHVELSQAMKRCESQASIGVDLGVKQLATLSNGIVFAGPKPLARELKRLRRKQRQLSRKQKGSNNRTKARLQVAKQYYRIGCIRKDALHKLTSYLCSNYATIAIEDLNVKGMMQNHCLARSVSDMGFYEFRRQLEYKSKLYGNTTHIADRWYPSSKQCSNCQTIKSDLSLSDREYHCDRCGLIIDRDINAAKNLLNLLNTVSSTEFQACGEDGSGLIR